MTHFTLANAKPAPTIYMKEGDYDVKLKKWVDVTYTAPLFERDGTIKCRATGIEGLMFADYYGEFRGNISYVNEKLEQWAKDSFGPSASWEWEDPETLTLHH